MRTDSISPLKRGTFASSTVDISMAFVAPFIVQIDRKVPIVLLGGIHVGCFELFGFSIYSLTDASRAGETMRAALQHAFGGNERVVLLVEQSMLGAKSFKN